jgi:hypothetical protein
MRPMNPWQEALRMMMTNANPWVALATAHSKSGVQDELVRRGDALAADEAAPVALAAAVARPALPAVERPSGWLARFFDRLEARVWEREQRAREAYLADAVDLADLEDRMRRYDRAVARQNRAYSYY